MVGFDRAAMEMLCSLEFWRMAVRWTHALLSSYFHLLFSSLRRRPLSPYPRRRPHLSPEINRPICIITGATSGLGAAAAMALAGEGYHVVLAGRSAQLLYTTIEEIKQQHQDACLDAFQVDLSSIHSVIKFENSIKQWLLDSNLHPSVQLLINNAGILATSCRATVDGYDQMLETNYISAFVLTNLLLPLLKNSPVPSRIVNVTSFTHRCVANMEVDVETFARRILSSSTRENSADPGFVETHIMREVPRCLTQLSFRVMRFLCLVHSAQSGVASIVDAALAPHDASGEYFFGGMGRTMKSSSLSYNANLASKLWSASFMLFEEARDSLTAVKD